MSCKLKRVLSFSCKIGGCGHIIQRWLQRSVAIRALWLEFYLIHKNDFSLFVDNNHIPIVKTFNTINNAIRFVFGWKCCFLRDCSQKSKRWLVAIFTNQYIIGTTKQISFTKGYASNYVIFNIEWSTLNLFHNTINSTKTKKFYLFQGHAFAITQTSSV